MDDFLTALALASMPALGNFFGGILAESYHISNRALSWALHLAAGVVLAIVGTELMPQALEAEPRWFVILTFLLGGAFFILLDSFTDMVSGRLGKDEARTNPWMIFIGTAVDLFSDGIMIGTGSIIDPRLGLLLALGQVPADIPEGFATIASLKNRYPSRSKRLLLAASFAIPIFLGTTVGYWAVRGRPDIYKLSLLSFTAGILVSVGVEEMITEAHAKRATMGGKHLEVLALVGGFALFVLLSTYFEV